MSERKELFDMFSRAHSLLFEIQQKLSVERRTNMYKVRLALSDAENAEISKDERAKLINEGVGD